MNKYEMEFELERKNMVKFVCKNWGIWKNEEEWGEI